MKISEQERNDVILRGGSKNFKLIAEDDFGQNITRFVVENKRNKKLYAFDGEHGGNFNYTYNPSLFEVEAQEITTTTYVKKEN